MKNKRTSWPLVMVSSELYTDSETGLRLNEILEGLEKEKVCTWMTCQTLEGANGMITTRADLGGILLDWETEMSDEDIPLTVESFISQVRKRNPKIPIILLTNHPEPEDIPMETLAKITGYVWKNADIVGVMAPQISQLLDIYIEEIPPPFFGALIHYAEELKNAWHTPGHLGGQGFLRGPAGVAFYNFFGPNTFRADLSISVGELGSLLDHTGFIGDAEKNSARVFGADLTYYVLNGTSTVNQIIWRSQLLSNEIALIDRNCHKSLNYAMIMTEAYPVYLIPRRNPRGMIGPVHLAQLTPESVQEKIKNSTLIPESAKNQRVRMMALTNSTYDGICYNVLQIKEQLRHTVDNFHFDEAWYAYAKFNPLYDGRYGMTESEIHPDDPPIFCSHSTHKLLTAFSQASMLHIRHGGKEKINPDVFNESYMMHCSTSPQYSMIASLDVATQIMDDQGEVLTSDILWEAIQLRKKIVLHKQAMEEEGSWFFDVWQPKMVTIGNQSIPLTLIDTEYLAHHAECWVMRKDDLWHGFEGIADNYAMLDPIKITITTPGINDAGVMSDEGIPAIILTNYLSSHNIVCEKTDYYSFLILNTLGTTHAKQNALLAALIQFQKLYDNDAPLITVFPDLVKKYPDRYRNQTLKEHCQEMHEYLKNSRMIPQMQAAFEVLPQQAMKPSDAYNEMIRKHVAYVDIQEMINRTSAVMIVPYPPGIPLLMGGETINACSEPILNYLIALQDYENKFQGYSNEIHGVERDVRDGSIIFQTLCLSEN